MIEGIYIGSNGKEIDIPKDDIDAKIKDNDWCLLLWGEMEKIRYD